MPEGSGLAGTVEEVAPNPSDPPETLTWTVKAEGAGALVIQRTYLPIYRIEVDEEEVTPWVANMHRIAVPVGAGEHLVRLAPTRLTFRLSTGMALVVAVGLVFFLRPRRATMP